MAKRKIIKINESKCTGCGLCIPSCGEGALQIINGKAKLVKEIYCDGLGACLGYCPEGAISIEEREAKVIKKLDCITHTLFVGEMTESNILKTGRPMTYDYYHQVKHGTTPKTAPTFIKGEDRTSAGPKMQRYICTVCGYVYDPEIGDIDSGIQPGTLFEDIPDTWVCPICGASKDKFVKE